MRMTNPATGPRVKMGRAATALFHPGLLWKEWRQFRWHWLLFFGLIILEPVLGSLSIRLFSFHNRVFDESGLTPEGWVLKSIIGNGSSTMEQIAVIGVVLLGAVMLGTERGGSLNYLASTAVSRRQILAAKWLLGHLSILVGMAALLLGMAAICTVNAGMIPPGLVLWWWARTIVILLALFSLALLSASIFASVLYSAVFAGFFLGLPLWLTGIVILPLTKFRVLTEAQSTLAQHWLNDLNVIEYISADSLAGLNHTGYFLGSMLVLLLADLLFLLLTMYFFEHNPLERSGEVFLSGNSKEKGRLGLAIFLSPFGAVDKAESWPQFFVYLLLIFIAIYLGMGIWWRLSARLGLGWRG